MKTILSVISAILILAASACSSDPESSYRELIEKAREQQTLTAKESAQATRLLIDRYQVNPPATPDDITGFMACITYIADPTLHGDAVPTLEQQDTLIHIYTDLLRVLGSSQTGISLIPADVTVVEDVNDIDTTSYSNVVMYETN